MGKFQIEQCGQIEGLYLIQPTVFGDNRGYFMETYNYNEFKELGLDMVFVQDNQSKSTKGSSAWYALPERTYAGQACPCDQR